MNLESGQPRSSGTLTALVVLVIIASGVVAVTTQLRSARPSGSGELGLHMRGGMMVPARLWDDPYGMSVKHFQENQDAVFRFLEGDLRGAVLAANGKKTQEVLAKDVEILLVNKSRPKRADKLDSYVRISKGSTPSSLEGPLSYVAGTYFGELSQLLGLESPTDVTVMPVLVPGEGYAEDIEDRIRCRYAVVAGLGRAGYRPINNDHLLYHLWIPTPIHDRALDGAPDAKFFFERLLDHFLVVPFELYKKQGRTDEIVLVLWIDEQYVSQPNAILEEHKKDSEKRNKKLDYARRPLTLTAQIANEFMSPVPKTPEGSKVSTSNLSLRILGPSSSSTLQYMIDELKDLETVEHLMGKSRTAEGSATKKHADDTQQLKLKYAKALLKALSTFSEKKRSIYSAWATVDAEVLLGWQGKERTGAEDAIEDLFLNVKLDFDRAGSDGRLFREIDLELNLRGINPSSNSKSHVVFVFEWDTLYGQSLRDTFTRELGRNEKNVHFRTYLRGLDGRSPNSVEDERGVKNESDEGGRSLYSVLATADTSSRATSLGRPTGANQADYLHRLRHDLSRLNRDLNATKSGRITAIGVVGSDEFDKLMILHALRSEFPECTFFTTDLDAAFLRKEENRFTRNLIVVSNFGLRLKKKYQDPTLPFRSSYQTATYWGTLRALGQMPEGATAGARIFEIGRTGAFDLSPSPGRDSIHPDNDLKRPFVISKQNFRITAYVGIILFLAWLLITPAFRDLCALLLGFHAHSEDGARKKIVWKSIAYFVAGLTVAIVLIILTLVAARNGSSDTGEPFVFFEGISVWPTVLLRTMILFLCIYFIYRIQFVDIPQLHRCEVGPEGIWEKVTPPADDGSIARSIFRWIPELGRFSEVAKTPLEAIEVYKRRIAPGRRFWRAGILTVLYIVAYIFTLSYSFYFRPYRGRVSDSVDEIVQWLLMLFFVALIVWVFDAALQCRAFILAFSKFEFWPKRPEGKPPKNEAAEDEAAHDAYVDARNHMHAAVAWFERIADETGIVARFGYYGIIVIFLTMIARSWYFDFYNWPVAVLVIYLALFATILAGLILVQNAARSVRRSYLRDFKDRYYSSDSGFEDEAIKHGIERIENLDHGAYGPFTQSPLIRAVAILIAGLGGFTGLTYL